MRQYNVWPRLWLFSAGLVMSYSAHAQLTVQPMNGGSLSPGSTGGGRFYYFVQTGQVNQPQAPGFVNFTPLSLLATAGSDSGGQGAFTVQLTLANLSLSSLSPNQAVVVTYQFAPVNPNAPRYLPIAFVNGAPCDANLCQGYNASGNNNNFYYAAKFNPLVSSQITLGFYPLDICNDYQLSALTGAGCSGAGGVNLPVVGRATTMSFSFSVQTVPDSNVNTIPDASTVVLDQVSGPIYLNFQIDTPQLTCPSTLVLNESYLPGDQSIFFNPDVFSLAQPNGCSNCAPLQSLYLVAQDNATPQLSSDFQVANSVASSLSIGQGFQRVAGFKNTDTSQGVDHPYQLSFILQDQAGIFAPSSSVNGLPSCLLTQVRSAEVRGYLKKNGCFIATAAFGTPDALPIDWLRQFRDKVLLSSSLGKRGVEWYYQWSPGAAAYLEHYPWLKIPVLFYLLPVELFVWIVLQFLN